MLTFLKQLFCIHDYEVDPFSTNDVFIELECRKCEKRKID